jgi:translocation and assembly module TamB
MTGTPENPLTRKRRSRVGHWFAGVLLAMVLLLAGLGWWAGSDGSLSRALQLVQRFLPEDQRLVVTEAKGSITGGGSIRRLQWSRPGILLTIDELKLDWTLRLLHRDLIVRTLSARSMHIRLTPQPEEPQDPFTMPAQVSLPVKVTTPLAISQIQVETVDGREVPSTLVFNDLAARYSYDGAQHVAKIDSLRYGQSHLQAEAHLHALTLAASAQLAASLRDLVPDAPSAMLARLQVSGTLAGGNSARLDLQLDVRQRPHGLTPPDSSKLLAELATLRTSFNDASSESASEAQIHVQTTLHPWRDQPLQQVLLQLTHLDAHAFHARAPVTAFRGRISLDPASNGAAAWDAVVDLANDVPGEWDRQRFPLRTLAASAHLSRERLDIESARADLGRRATSGTLSISGEIQLQALSRSRLQTELRLVDLRALMTTLPGTAFSGLVTIEPWQQDSWRAQADVRNTLVGPFDRDRAPLHRLLADLRFAPAKWSIETLEAQVDSGRVQVRGHYVPTTGALDLSGELQGLPLRQVHRKMSNDLASQLSGKANVAGVVKKGLAFSADVASSGSGNARRGEWEIRSMQAKGNWSPTRLVVEHIHLDGFQAIIDGSGIDVVLPGLESIRAHVTASAPGVSLAAEAAMQQQSGGGKLSVQLASASQVENWLRGLPMAQGRVPDLHASGSALLEADWQGGWKQWLAGLKNPSAHPQLRMNAVAQSDGLRLDLPAGTGQPPMRIDVQALDLDVQGNLAAAMVAISVNARAGETHALLDLRLQATQMRSAANAPRWNIALEKFTASANLRDQEQAWQLQLSDNLQVQVQPGADLELSASAGSATLRAPAGTSAGDEPLLLAWQPLLWRRTAGGAHTLQSRGTVTGIQPAWADVLLAKKKGGGPIEGAGMHTDLSLSGDWDVRMTDSLSIRAHIQRQRGDLSLTDPGISAGIRAFDLQAQSEGENISLELNWDTERAGVITARLGTRVLQQADGWSLPDSAPLSGDLHASVQNLATWAFLAPPGWRIAGALDADLRLGGTVQSPQFTGSIEGAGLNLRSVLDGVDLHNGTLRATLSGSRMEIAELAFEGGTGSRAYVRGFSGNRTSPPVERGSMNVSGHIDWSAVRNAGDAQSGIAMDLRARLQEMQVLVRNDRQMSLSGDLSAGLNAGTLRIRGSLAVDRASIVLPEASAPTLGDDVVVIRNTDLRNPGAVEARQARGELRTRKPLDMEIRLDLGDDLALEGQGITTRLEGELTVRSATYGSEPFSVFGEVRTDEGRYRAWGQALNVETGVVRFNGPYSNPSLNLLAIRPEIDVRAGVRVTGTLNAPRVQLFSDPDLPEGEKLSWVVLGRPTVIAGAEGSSMQQAALGLAAGQLSGKLASGIGLDELGLAETGVTVGKRLSNELYLTYQAGLSGAASTLFIFYDITRRLTLRAQTGDASAVDLVYTITYD